MNRGRSAENIKYLVDYTGDIPIENKRFMQKPRLEVGIEDKGRIER